MSQKVYLNILKYGAYLSLICVFFVFKSFLFPFITSKQIPFNMLVEVLLILWVAFIVKYPEYRPKKSWVTIGLAAFFAVTWVSSFTGVDFNLSFWGDVERMLGVFHILHFLGLYLIIITVMRTWQDWQIFFIVSLVFCLAVCLKGLTGVSYSTIGNTAYVSGYIIFNLYFAFLLFFKEEHKGLRWLYLVPIPIYLMAFKKAGTNGAFAGLSFSVIVLFFLYGIFSKNKKLKYATISVFIALTALAGFALTNRDNPIVVNTPVLKQFRGINVNKRTFQTRLISWRAAIKDFPSHPILGTGHGNFAITFDKYFEPTFYDYTRSETYFDRAHNNVIDIATTTGSLGLFTYLFMLIAAGYYLVRGYFKEKFNLHEFVLLSALGIAYFVQNLAVFDSFVTYISLMITLGFVYWKYFIEDEEEKEPRDQPLINKEIYTIAVAGVVFLTILYQYNVKPIQMLSGTIAGQRALGQGIEAAAAEYEKALSYNSVLDRDSRTSLIRVFLSNPSALKNVDKARADEIMNWVIDLAEANVAYNEHDSLSQMMLAQIYNTAASMNTGNQEKFAFYSDQALEAIDKSIAASPGRTPIYFQKAQIYLNRGDKDNAISTLEYAANLNPNYPDGYCYLARTYFYYKMEDEGYDNVDKCIDADGARWVLRDANLVKNYINHYIEKEDWDRTLKLYEGLANIENKNAETWIKLAKLYAQLGQKDKAIETAEKVIEMDPSMERYAREFIDGL